MAGFRDMDRLEDMTLDGRRVLVRVDLDCPIDDSGRVTDDSRIQICLPTIRHLIAEGARVVLASSLGSPGGRRNGRLSMAPVAERLAEILDCDIYLPEDTVGEGPWKVIMERVEGEVVLLENLGFHAEDERNDDLFAQRLFGLADVFVNEAFRLSDRELASTVGVAGLFNEKTVGIRFRREVEMLSRVTASADSQLGVIFGGEDDSFALEYLTGQLGRVQRAFIGSRVALPFLAARGFPTGCVKVDKDKVEAAGKILSRAQVRGVDIVLPVDVVVKPSGAGDDDAFTVRADGIPADCEVMDIGQVTVETFPATFLTGRDGARKPVRTLVWHGALGRVGTPAFCEGSARVAKLVSRSAACATVIGDEMAELVSRLVLTPFFAHVSAGGDVGVKLMLGRELPAIKAICGGL
ncbi:MAG TPA: phosphoglycerate kinase [Myxococcota bacterium]|nr:phosphoglycerate kinase [Myxococcota bacterium]